MKDSISSLRTFMLDNRYYLEIKLNSSSFFGLLDSGSTRTYGGKSIGSLVKLTSPDSSMTVANNMEVPIEGMCNLKFSTDDNFAQIPIRIVDCLSYDLVLGIDFLMAFSFVINFGNDTYSFGGGECRKFSGPPNSVSSPFNVEQSHDWISAPNSTTRYFLDICIKGHKVRALVDSGSTKTYVGKIFKKILQGIRPSNATVSVANGNQ